MKPFRIMNVHIIRLEFQKPLTLESTYQESASTRRQPVSGQHRRHTPRSTFRQLTNTGVIPSVLV